MNPACVAKRFPAARTYASPGASGVSSTSSTSAAPSGNCTGVGVWTRVCGGGEERPYAKPASSTSAAPSGNCAHVEAWTRVCG
eukprot:364767-Chlamydomonas_euryale.AAC.2